MRLNENADAKFNFLGSLKCGTVIRCQYDPHAGRALLAHYTAGSFPAAAGSLQPVPPTSLPHFSSSCSFRVHFEQENIADEMSAATTSGCTI